MLNTREKQGYLGNLHSKSTKELFDLLQRQESLLSKKKFIGSMPDKGRKVHAFAEKLREILKSRDPSLVVTNRSSSNNEKPEKHLTSPESSAGQEEEHFKNPVKHETEQTTNTSLSNPVTMTTNENVSLLSQSQDTTRPRAATTDKHGEPESDSVEMQPEQNNIQNLQNEFDKMEIVSKEDEISKRLQQEKSTNAFGKALAMSEQIPSHFQTNRSLKITSMQDLPEKYKPKAKENMNRTKFNLHDGDSAATPPVYKHDSTQLVSIDESVQLQKQQKLKQEEIQARTAAEKLAERINIPMENYSPEGIDMSYRVAEQDIDSDDDVE